MQAAMHAARLAQLEGAILGLMRDDADHQHDSITIEVTRDIDGAVSIDLTYMAHGMPLSGEGI